MIIILKSSGSNTWTVARMREKVDVGVSMVYKV